MVLLGSSSRKATTNTGRTRRPARSQGSSPRPSVDSLGPVLDLPKDNEPFREAYQSHSPHALQQAPSEPLLEQLQRKETAVDEDGHHSIVRRKQLKVYHKIPKKKKREPVSLRPSPGQAMIGLAIDMITEFELLMTQIGIGPVCVPQETKSRKATTDSRNATQREPPPPLEEDVTDLDTLNESHCSTAQESNRYFPLRGLRQPSHLSYTTIRSGEVELEMEESFDDSYDYRDDITFEERSDTESYDDDEDEEDDDDDDSSSGRSGSVDASHQLSQNRWPANVSHGYERILDHLIFPLSIQNVFVKPWYGADADRVPRTLSIHANNDKPLSGPSGNGTLVKINHGDNPGAEETMVCLEHESFCSSGRGQEKPWILSMLDPLLSHLYYCGANFDSPRESSSNWLRRASKESKRLSHNHVTTTSREPGNDCFNDNRTREKENASFTLSRSGNTKKKKTSLQDGALPRESPIGAGDSHASSNSGSTRVLQWERLLAALSADSMDDRGRRQVTFSPSVTSHQDKTNSTGSLSRKEYLDFTEKKPVVQPRQRGRVWQRRKNQNPRTGKL